MVAGTPRILHAWLLPLLAGLLMLLAVCCSCGEDDEDDEEGQDELVACEGYADPSYLGYINNENLKELSGLAVSMQNPGVLWMHNDSGHGPVVYALNEERESLGRLILDGADQIDWEDIAVGPCEQGECLFVGDIGDNEETRDSIRIFAFEEPEIDASEAFGDLLITEYETRVYSFLDKAHDSEGLAVHPDGTVYLFTKEPGICNMFRVPEPSEAEPQVLDYVGHFTMTDNVTAADIHRNGLRLLLRTPDRIYEWRLDSGSSFESIFEAPRTIVQAGLAEQGEAIGYDSRAGELFHASESVADEFPKLFRISCQ